MGSSSQRWAFSRTTEATTSPWTGFRASPPWRAFTTSTTALSTRTSASPTSSIGCTGRMRGNHDPPARQEQDIPSKRDHLISILRFSDLFCTFGTVDLNYFLEIRDLEQDYAIYS